MFGSHCERVRRNSHQKFRTVILPFLTEANHRVYGYCLAVHCIQLYFCAKETEKRGSFALLHRNHTVDYSAAVTQSTERRDIRPSKQKERWPRGIHVGFFGGSAV